MRWGEIIRRLVLIPPTLVGVAVIVFVLLRVVPGDPIAMMLRFARRHRPAAGVLWT